MAHQCILTERDGAVLRVTLNRPDRLNSLNLQLVTELAAVAAEVRGDSAVRAVLLTGSGRAFCTGADLKDPALAGEAGKPAGAHVAHTMRTAMSPMIQHWYRLPVPVVVAVNGIATGAGVSLALAGDIAVATESASFSMPFIPRLGIIPDLGATFSLPQRLSTARLNGLALLGESISARVAAEWGLIWACVGDDVFAAHTTALAHRLASAPTQAIAALKELLADGAGQSLEAQLEREAQIQGALADTKDFQEGVAAFRAKRAPRFEGR
ncbi:MAG: enoyl-CoA hydratase-related protein [Gammaproteobacteria bacterium]